MSLANPQTRRILEMIADGHSLQKIHEETGVTIGYLNRNFAHYYKKKKQKPLGHKDEPYYDSEEEMLKDKVYTYESLSDSEKAIYDKLAGDD